MGTQLKKTLKCVTETREEQKFTNLEKRMRELKKREEPEGWVSDSNRG